jgi:hypothetical protein
MVKTGVTFLDFASLVIILLPLVPVFIIFIRKVYHLETLNFLIAVCLLTFLQNLLLILPTGLHLDPASLRAVFSLFDFACLILLFRTTFHKTMLREGLSVLAFSILSMAITLYTIRGTEKIFWPISILIAFILIGIILISLFRLIMSNTIYIFNSPLFWIGGGTLCFYGMYILTEAVTVYRWDVSKNLEEQKAGLLSFTAIIRFTAYVVAAWVAKMDHRQS